MRLLRATILVVLVSWLSIPTFASALGDAAARLAPGESIRLATPDFWKSAELEPLGNCCTILAYGQSGVWDATRREVRWIGKKPHGFPYYFLVYSEQNGRWSSDRPLHPDLSADKPGHGYDHNAIDPVSGAHYFRLYDTKIVYKWDGSWSRLPDLPGDAQGAEALTWFDGVGLVYTDTYGCRVFRNDSWSWCLQDGDLETFGYHSISEYQPKARVMLLGGGNNAPRLFYRLERDAAGGWKHTRIPDAPTGLGNKPDQGILVADPAGDTFVAWARSSSEWWQFDPKSNSWTRLQQASGDGSSPITGTPPLPVGGTGAVIAVPISTHGVIMFVDGVSRQDSVWLYRHGSQPPSSEVPSAPTGLEAN